MKSHETHPNGDPMYMPPTTDVVLTAVEAAEIQAEINSIQTQLGRPSGERPEPLTWSEEQNLKARLADLKAQLHRAQHRPTGPSATPASNAEGEMALNDETLDTALRSMTPGERKEFGREVSKVLRAAKKLAADLGRADLAGTVANVGADVGFLDPVPYHQ